MNPSYIDWNRIYLTDNPFLIEPPTDPTRVKWAGMKTLRKQLELILKEALSTSRTQVVLNRGGIGSGKTHAARYYSLPANMPEIRGKKAAQLCLYIRTPKEPEQGVRQLYQQTIDQISITDLREKLNQASRKLSERHFINHYQDMTGSEEFAKAFRKLATCNDEEVNVLSRYFLLTGVTKTELKRLGLARTINTLLDQTAIMCALLNSFIGIDHHLTADKHTRVFAWIDEMEDFVYYPARYHRSFTQALRDLIDRVPNFLTIFMNFTMTVPEDEKEIEVILGGYLMDRITHQIKFEELKVKESLEYIGDLLRQYRTPDFKKEKLAETYPFKEETLRKMVETIDRRTPRSIHKTCYNILSKKFEENFFATIKKWIHTKDLK